MQSLNSKSDLIHFKRMNALVLKKVGFVPTMGALHAGHLSLVEALLPKCDLVIASIYVNPTQFAPHEDFNTYPRDTGADVEKLASAGVAAVYFPRTDEIYPTGNKTNIRVETMSDILDGTFRPHFFYGVTNVVARLFGHVGPDIAAFGEKDFQQLQIIKRMTEDLGLPIEILGVPTARAETGLALSSRNIYLNDTQNTIAPTLFQALTTAKSRVVSGAPIAASEMAARLTLTEAGFDKIDYVSVVDKTTLSPANSATRSEDLRALGAAWLGKTRLIDNV